MMPTCLYKRTMAAAEKEADAAGAKGADINNKQVIFKTTVCYSVAVWVK